MSSNVHVSFEHPQAYSPWSLGSGFHMADHAIHMPNYYYYHHQQQQAVNGGAGSVYGYGYGYSSHRDGVGEREHLFEKPLTPSDVGKLNRLVIPKQHAEKHFPLDGESGEKGLLLSFEDEAGKAWRFRYSYWTSSQSYVLTKGWSRFVKEKRLDAGDVVLFQRRRSDADHLYIGCKRRGEPTVQAQAPRPPQPAVASNHAAPISNAAAGTPPWTTQVLYGTPQHELPAAAAPYLYMDNSNASHHHGEADGGHAAGHRSQGSNASSSTNSKRLRLFGVNLDLECGVGAESSSSSAEARQQQQHRQFSVPTHQGQRELQFLPCIDGSSTYL